MAQVQQAKDLQQTETLRFTRLCKYWNNNRCNMGANCNFAHDSRELRAQPDLMATRLCFQFSRKGTCKNGDDCKYAHGKSELRRTPAEKPKLPQELETRKAPQLSQLPLPKKAQVDTLRPAPAFAPPPGLEFLPPGLFEEERASLDTALPRELPMMIDLKSLTCRDGSDSTSTAAMSGSPGPSDSEPLSPQSSETSVSFWL
mmetsp:Transcript_7444/g.12834  ORF Transcript_7444/g.12834 Transcript_7444/m.12834 type:complete len:201 (+) Transcript_7444:74-676(+)